MEREPKRFSRRTFLKGTAVAIASAFAPNAFPLQKAHAKNKNIEEIISTPIDAETAFRNPEELFKQVKNKIEKKPGTMWITGLEEKFLDISDADKEVLSIAFRDKENGGLGYGKTVWDLFQGIKKMNQEKSFKAYSVWWCLNKIINQYNNSDYQHKGDGSVFSDLRFVIDSCRIAVADTQEKGYSDYQSQKQNYVRAGLGIKNDNLSKWPLYKFTPYLPNIGLGIYEVIMTKGGGHFDSSGINRIIGTIEVNSSLFNSIHEAFHAHDPNHDQLLSDFIYHHPEDTFNLIGKYTEALGLLFQGIDSLSLEEINVLLSNNIFPIQPFGSSDITSEKESNHHADMLDQAIAGALRIKGFPKNNFNAIVDQRDLLRENKYDGRWPADQTISADLVKIFAGVRKECQKLIADGKKPDDELIKTYYCLEKVVVDGYIHFLTGPYDEYLVPVAAYTLTINPYKQAGDAIQKAQTRGVPQNILNVASPILIKAGEIQAEKAKLVGADTTPYYKSPDDLLNVFSKIG